jgi:hypothetical protein
MASAREQYRPPDDRVEVAPGLKGSEFDRWEYASALGDANTAARIAGDKEQARQEPEPPATPQRYAQEVAPVRADPDSSVYAPPRKHTEPRGPVSTLSRRQALAFALTGKRQKP